MTYEERGKDYSCYFERRGISSIKLPKAMTKIERRTWFTDKEIIAWKKMYPKGEYRGSLP